MSPRWSRPKLGSAGRSSQDEADNDQGHRGQSLTEACRQPGGGVTFPGTPGRVHCVAVPCRDRGLGKEVTVASSWFAMRYTQLLELFLTAMGMGPAESGI